MGGTFSPIFRILSYINHPFLGDSPFMATHTPPWHPKVSPATDLMRAPGDGMGRHQHQLRGLQ